MDCLSEEGEILYTQLNRLIGELLRGKIGRHVFLPWEIDFLLELEDCGLRPAARRDLLRSYRKAVLRHFEDKSGPPPKFAEFLKSRRKRNCRNGHAAVEVVEVGTEGPG